MGKYGNFAKAITSKVNPSTVGTSRRRKLAVLTVVVAVLAVLLGGYFIHTSRESTGPITSKVDLKVLNFSVTADGCKQNITKLEAVKPDKRDPQAATIYGFIGSCYYLTGQYKQALTAFQKAQASCGYSADKRCQKTTEDQITLSQYAIDHPAPANPKVHNEDVTPEFKQKLQQGGQG